MNIGNKISIYHAVPEYIAHCHCLYINVSYNISVEARIHKDPSYVKIHNVIWRNVRMNVFNEVFSYIGREFRGRSL